jgi:hypothetical protein
MAKSVNDRRIDYGPNYCEFGDGRLTGGFATSDSPAPGGPLVILYADDLEKYVVSGFSRTMRNDAGNARCDSCRWYEV